MRSLDSLLAWIDPIFTIDKAEERANRAFNRLVAKNRHFIDDADFYKLIAQFKSKMFLAIIGMPSLDKYDFNEGVLEGKELLQEIYGPRGHSWAYKAARDNVEGGIYGIFKKITTRLVTQHVNMTIADKVNSYINEWAESGRILDVLMEYKSKYEGFVPELRDLTAEEILPVFRKILINHPWLIKSIRQIGKM